MKSASLILSLILLISGAAYAQAGDGLQDLERAATAELQETGTPGLALAVIRDGRVVLAKGLGAASLETGQPVTPDTLFHVGSVTKTLTAAAVVTLTEQGKLQLDEPVGRWVDGLAPGLAKLTLHQLLSNTAGLGDQHGGDGLHEEAALAAFVLSRTDRDLLLPPGKVFSYSNLGYALAGLVLERVTGKPYADAMREILFEPLGMTRTTLRPLAAMTWPLAVGHEPQETGPPQVVRPMADDTRIWPAGYAFTSLNDLSRFVIALLDGGRLEGRQVLPPRVAARMLAPVADIPTNVFVRGRYGYGLFREESRGVPVAFHAGTLPGYSAEFRMIPERRAAVLVLSNRSDNRMEKTFTRALDLLLPGVAPPAAEPRRELAMTAEEMQRYVGTYANRWSMDIFVRDGRLFLRRFGAELPITRIGDNRFSVQPEGAPQAQEFVIVPGAGGRPEILQMFLWGFRRTS
jgi:CubicO group peptidase (beta-lactamase class C family)